MTIKNFFFENTEYYIAIEKFTNGLADLKRWLHIEVKSLILKNIQTRNN